MAQSTQVLFSHRDLIELLIKNAGIHDGRWSLLLNLSVGTGHMAVPPDQTGPGVMVVVTSVGLQRLQDGIDAGKDAIVVDATEVNPEPK
ncbi:MAG: hypothetical protein HYX37_21165 [Rhizobiales bacterium]|nr:hypothetical protein [Hyphomicrobiales bacterium]